AREHIDLRARVVDVIFARRLVAREGQQIGERIAEHRAPAMPDMNWTGGVGRDIFDIYRHASPKLAAAELVAFPQHGPDNFRPDRAFQLNIDEARSGDRDAFDLFKPLKTLPDNVGKVAR